MSSSEAMPDHSLQEGISSCKALQECNDNTAEPSSYSSSLMPGALNVEDTDTATFTKDLKSKKSVRRNRNALLNSLTNYSAVAKAESGNKCEMETHVPVQNYDSSYDYGLNCTNTISDHFKNGTKWPNEVGRISVNDIKVSAKNSDSSFQLRQEEFPPL
jgi:hypothetical protein